LTHPFILISRDPSLSPIPTSPSHRRGAREAATASVMDLAAAGAEMAVGKPHAPPSWIWPSAPWHSTRRGNLHKTRRRWWCGASQWCDDLPSSSRRSGTTMVAQRHGGAGAAAVPQGTARGRRHEFPAMQCTYSVQFDQAFG
jgi:hypothetical protein